MIVYIVYSRDYETSWDLVAIFTDVDNAIGYTRINNKPMTRVVRWLVDDPTHLIELRNYDLIAGKGVEVKI